MLVPAGGGRHPASRGVGGENGAPAVNELTAARRPDAPHRGRSGTAARRRTPRAPTGRESLFRLRRIDVGADSAGMRSQALAAAPGAPRCGGGLRRRPPVALGPWVLRRRQAAGGWRCGHPSCQTARGPALSAGGDGGGLGGSGSDSETLLCGPASGRKGPEGRSRAIKDRVSARGPHSQLQQGLRLGADDINDMPFATLLSAHIAPISAHIGKKAYHLCHQNYNAGKSNDCSSQVTALGRLMPRVTTPWATPESSQERNRTQLPQITDLMT